MSQRRRPFSRVRPPYADLQAATEKIDKRHTRYRFDLETDMPWSEGLAGELHLPPRLLASMGVDAEALERHPEAWELFQWCAGLEICESFSALERYLLDFVDAEHLSLGPSRSALLLYQEERKHIALFDRYAEILKQARPEWIEAFEDAFAPTRPQLLHPYTQDTYAGQPAVQHYFFWLKTLFFEEYTIYLDDRLQEETGRVKPLWLAAHYCHRKEEQQHVVTDLAHVQALDLSDKERRACATTFWLHLESTFELFLGVAASKRLIRARFPECAEAVPDVSTRDLPIFADLATHSAFRGTRKCAPRPRSQRPTPVPVPRRRAPTVPGSELIGPAQLPVSESLVDCLHRAATTNRGITWIEERRDDRFQAYSELLDQGLNVLDALRHQGLQAGHKVIVSVERPDVAVPVLWGCLLGGIVPALVAPGAAHVERLQRVQEQLGDPPLIDEDVAAALIEHRAGHPVQPADVSLDDLAILQFSSGSTGEPQGVELTHRNLVANTRGIIEHLGGRNDDVFLSWLPLSHDMGLIGYHLLPIVLGVDQALMRPRHFLKRPLDWLKALDRLRVNVTASPTFGLSTTIDRVDAEAIGHLDLSSVRTLLLGAEPISPEVMERFATTLKPAGLHETALTPAYGLAEGTLCLTGRPQAEPNRIQRFERASLHGGTARPDPTGMPLVAVGTALPGVRLRIVDDAGQPVPRGTVGEIEARGVTVSRGYHGSEARPASAFRGQWLRTGDLGLVAEGQLWVCGRRKEVLFVNGQKLYAHDVEAALACVPGVHPRRIAVFGCQDPREGRDLLCVALNIRNRDQERSVVQGLSSEMAVRFGTKPDHVFLVGSRDIPRTSSGKLRRHVLRQRFQAGVLIPFAPAALVEIAKAPEGTPAPDVRAIVRAAWCEALEIHESDFSDEDDFRVLGGSSMRAAMVQATVEDELERVVPHEVVLDAYTVSTLVERLEGLLDADGPKDADEDDTEPAPRTVPALREDDIAVIGIGVRLPGVDTPEAFWQVLAEGRDQFGPVPADRWDHQALRAEDPTLCPSGAFVDHVFDFDPAPFGLSAQDASTMEPRQRLFLEAAGAALRDAGSGAGSVGVFVSQGENPLGARSFLDDLQAGERGVGGKLENSTNSIVASRVTRAFGLTGPAMVVQAACASSLVAVHQARRALQNGDCELAIAGGVEVTHSPTTYALFGPNQVLSSTGKCVPFSTEADGFVPGEGAAAIVLKRLDRAIADGDRVLAVIKGSAVTSDGESFSGMAPNPRGQVDAARQALSQAEIDPGSIGMIEAHGTATAIGDAVELKAMRTVYDGGSPVGITSVKSNFGHLFAAAGITAVIKTVLAVHKGQIPPIAHFTSDDPRHALSKSALSPVRTLLEWPVDGPRRAAVNGLGIGGVNSHLVFEEAPAAAVPDLPGLICVSGRSEQELRRDAQVLADALRDRVLPLSPVCASVGRRSIPQRRARLSTAVDSTVDAVRWLDAVAKGAEIPGHPEKLVVVFPGPGAQAPNPCGALRDDPVFQQALEDCETLIRDEMGLGLEALLAQADRRIDYAQPAVFALSWATWSWMCSVGVRAEAVIGHSAGEYAAAAAAGMLSMDEALRALIVRGQAMAKTRPGAMAAVFGDIAEVERLQGVEIAAYNGPRQVVISGETEDLQRWLATLDAAGVRARALSIPCAAHSVAMEQAQAELAAAVAELDFRTGRIPMFSTLTGEATTQLSAEHLVRQLRAPVVFEKAVRSALAGGYRCFAEVGAAAILSPAIEATAEGSGAIVTGIHRSGQGKEATLAALGTLFRAGQDLRFGRLCAGEIALPPVSYARTAYPIPFAEAQAQRVGKPRPQATVLDEVERRIFQDHRAQGKAIGPGAWMFDRLFATQSGPCTLQDVAITAPAPLELEEYAVRQDGGRTSLVSRIGETWTTHVSGRFSEGAEIEVPPEPRGELLDTRELYAALEAGGLSYGPTMRTLRTVHRDGDEVWAELQPGAPLTVECIDPTVLDGAFQALIGLIAGRISVGQPLLGFAAREIRWLRPLVGPCRAYVRLRHLQEELLRCDITLVDALGRPCLSLRDFAARRARLSEGGMSLQALGWCPLRLPAAHPPAGGIALIGEAYDLARRLLDRTEGHVFGPFTADHPGTELALRQAQTTIVVDPSFSELATLARHPAQGRWLVLTPTRAVAAMARSLGAEQGVPVQVVLSAEEVPAERVFEALSTDKPVLSWEEGWRMPTLSPVSRDVHVPVEDDGVYWVLGGSGGIGAALAERLATAGAQTLVITGRRPALDPEIRDRLESPGAQVTYVQADLGHPREVQKAVDEIVRRHGHITGVIHSAGVLDDGPLAGRSSERMAAVQAAKVVGGESLARALADTPLSFVVLVSSLSSLVPSPGQADYSGANGALDDLAHRWPGPVDRIVSIHYGPWGEVGRVATAEHRERLTRAGLLPMDTNTGVQACFAALAAEAKQVVAVCLPPGGEPRLEKAVGAGPPPATQDQPEPAAPAQPVRPADAPESGVSIEAVVLRAIQTRVPIPELDTSVTFAELGVDSIGGVEMVRVLEAELGVSLHATLLFEHPTVGGLCFALRELVATGDE